MTATKKILLSGASGLIGGATRLALQLQGYEVYALQRARAQLLPGDVHWDPQSGVLQASDLEGFTAIIHLAGESIANGRWNADKKQRIVASRVQSTTLLSQAIAGLRHPPQLFLTASAIGYYGDRGATELDESATPGTGFLAEVCSAWEEASRAAMLKGVRTINLRIGVVLTPQGGALQQMLPAYRLGFGGKLGDGQQYMSWITLHDLTRVILHCLETPNLQGAVNAVATQAVTNHEFSQTLAKVLRRPSRLTLPATMARLALGEMAKELLLASMRVVPKKLLDSGFSFTHGNLHPALHDLVHDYQIGDRHFATQCWVPKARHDLFAFFCEPKNLERLTPGWLQFAVTDQSTPTVGEGSEFAYRLKLHGVPVHWRSRIERWQPDQAFADRQLKGPYEYWYHTHRFFTHAEGTLMTDEVHYRLPLGLIGLLLGGAYVRRDIARIFAYRQQVIQELFSR